MRRQRIAPGPIWPAWFYSPINEDCGIFSSEETVPEGWTRKRGVPEPVIEVHASVVLNKEDLRRALTGMGVDINPQWGSAHMKKVVDGDASPTW